MLNQMEVIRNPETVVWRYMSLYKFEDLLRTGEIYCTRVDQFGDQLEGTRTRPSFERGMKHSMARYRAEFGMGVEHSFVGALGVEEASRSFTREGIFANCWHKNKRASPKMWERYGQQGVAIQSTIGRLFASTRAPEGGYLVHTQSIVYVDHDLADSDEFEAFIYKDLSYSSEREVRIFIINIPERNGVQLPADFPTHLRAPCDLATLIVSVHLPPQSHHLATVRALLDGAGLSLVPIVS